MSQAIAAFNKCSCGRRISRQANECRTCSRQKMDRIHAEAEVIVATGKCPNCGNPLRRNNSLTGWWQCVCCCSPDFGPAEYRDKPRCSFQCFTA